MEIFTGPEIEQVRRDFSELLGVDLDGNDGGSLQVTITRPGTRTLDETTLLLSSTDTTIYSGTALLYPIVYRRERQELVSEESVRPRVYRAVIPYGSDEVWIDDILTVTSSSHSPHFVGRTMTVTDVEHETFSALQRLSLTDIAEDGESSY